jgi:hypothetical protein
MGTKRGVGYLFHVSYPARENQVGRLLRGRVLISPSTTTEDPYKPRRCPINRPMPLANMLLSALQSWSLRYALERIFSCLFSWSKSPRMPSASWISNRYPPTRRSEHVDIYRSANRGEVVVPDPYHWLETDSDETDKWTSAQEAFTRDYLDKIQDLERLRTAFQDCVDYPKVRNPCDYNSCH